MTNLGILPIVCAAILVAFALINLLIFAALIRSSQLTQAQERASGVYVEQEFAMGTGSVQAHTTPSASRPVHGQALPYAKQPRII